ncbi:MAG: hypothetical protein H6Q13_3547 [Bacteroidetes bacterium]|nr:hypothetical protein [Bacteroidota bacterium]
MKKKILLSMVVVAIAVFASYNVYISNHSTMLSDLALANVEALAKDFEWDGTDWTTDSQWYNSIGSHWTPTLVACTETYGFDYGIVALITINGKMVVCSAGSGNCRNGSGCTAG